MSKSNLLTQEKYIEDIKKENQEYFENTGYKKKYFSTTFGCQANERDTETISGILEDLGYKTTTDKQQADVIIFNTCLIRENAELKIYGHIGELVHLKRKNPDLLIAICGCMMQKKEIRDLIKEKYSYIDLIFGTHNIYRLPEFIASSKNTSKTQTYIWDDSDKIIEGLPSSRAEEYKGLINITYGCNNFCTYCVVPYARGREKSREPLDIIEEITQLAKNNCKEITLLGQNVNSYGKTLEDKVSFAELLRRVNEIEGIERIRFMTSHPKDLSDQLIYAIRDCDKVCKHVHLPIQSGSNNVLKAMNRKYTREDYIKIVEKLRKEIPDIAITTDIIVGFPGETQQDFEDTLSLIEQVKYDSAFTFKYSIRDGTPAAKMPNQIDEDIKQERFQQLLKTLNPIVHENSLKLKGTVQRVLVDEINKKDTTMLSGRTEGNKAVYFKGSSDLIGTIVDVKIDDISTWSLQGYIIKDN